MLRLKPHIRGSDLPPPLPPPPLPLPLPRPLPRIIVAPITSKGQALGCRPEITLNGQTGRILLDQLRSIDKQRLGKKMGEIPVKVWLPTLLEMFAE